MILNNFTFLKLKFKKWQAATSNWLLVANFTDLPFVSKNLQLYLNGGLSL